MNDRMNWLHREAAADVPGDHRTLEQLQLTLAREVERRRSLEVEASNARAALALLRAQLLGGRGPVVAHRRPITTDDLTGLADRAALLERFRLLAERHGASRSGLAMVVVAFEGFAAIKDGHGHDISDALLRVVAARLVRALRCDDLVSRLGGDEFACLLCDMPNRDMLSHLACKLFDSVAAPISIGSLQFTLRPSLGIAICPDDGDDAPTLLDCAKAASQRARRQCSGYAFYDPPLATLAANPDGRTAGHRQAALGQR